MITKNKEKNPKVQKSKHDLDTFTFEEIENDFNALKARSEEVKVQNELLNILRNATKDTSFEEDVKDWKNNRRTENPYFMNYSEDEKDKKDGKNEDWKIE